MAVWRGMCVVWNNARDHSGVWLDVEWCSVKCGGRNVICNGNMLYIPHLTDYSSTIFHIETPGFRHSTPYHISFHILPPDHTWRDVNSVVWNLVWCGRCALLGTTSHMGHTSQWVSGCKARLSDVEYVRYGVMLHVIPCNVRWEIWWCDVEWCGTCGKWWCAVKTDAKCGYGIPSRMWNGLTAPY